MTATLPDATRKQVLAWLEQIETLGMSVRSSALKAAQALRAGDESKLGAVLGQSDDLAKYARWIMQAMQ